MKADVLRGSTPDKQLTPKQEKNVRGIAKGFQALLACIFSSGEEVTHIPSSSASKGRYPGEIRYRATTWDAVAAERRRRRS